MLDWRLHLTFSIAEQSLSNDSLHNPSPPPKISNATKRRINKAKRQGIKPSEVEVDGNRVQGLPTFISEPSSLQVAGPPEIHVTSAANFQPNHNINLHQFNHVNPQNFASHIYVPRGGGGLTTARDAMNDSTSSSSGMDEVDATVCDKNFRTQRDNGSFVLRKDLMMPQDTSPDSGRETPNDIESDGQPLVTVQSIMEACVTETADVTEKTAELKLEAICSSEEQVLAQSVDTASVDSGESIESAVSERCDQSG